MRIVISGRRGVCGAVLGSLILAFSACSSAKHETQPRKLISDLEAELPTVPKDVLKLGGFNRELHVKDLSLIGLGNHRAAVIRLFDVTRLQANLPVLIHVTGPARELVYSNGGAGLDPTIQRIGVLLPGREAWWVDDQISVSTGTAGFNVRVGRGTHPDPHSVPKLTTTGVSLDIRQGRGSVSGTLVNGSSSRQHDIVISAVVVRQKAPVAAGRTVVRTLPAAPGRVPFHIALVGAPKGGKVELSVIPTIG